MVAAGAHGHVNPNLPVITELVARGHRVKYAVPEPFVEAAASTGATPLVTNSLLPGTRGGPERWPVDPIEGMAFFLDEAMHVTPQLVAGLDDDRPDLFLADIGGYPARVLALRWGVPLVQLSPAIVAWEGYEADNPEVVAMLHDDPRGVAYLRRFADWLAARRGWTSTRRRSPVGRRARSCSSRGRSSRTPPGSTPTSTRSSAPAWTHGRTKRDGRSRTGRSCWFQWARPTPRTRGSIGRARKRSAMGPAAS
jgi:hypothetical protein